VDAESRQQPPANEGSYDPDNEVTDEPKPGALHDLAGEPSCNESDHQYDKETFTRHGTLSWISNEFAIAGSVSDPLQILHQIVLLRAAEIEVLVTAEATRGRTEGCLTRESSVEPPGFT
jgi:hypothetical protein